MSGYFSWISGIRTASNHVGTQDDAGDVVDMVKHIEHYHHGVAPSPGHCKYLDQVRADLAKEDELNTDFRSFGQENEGVRSYVTKAEKSGKRWIEVKSKNGKSTRNDHDEWLKKGKHDKWYSLPEVVQDEKPDYEVMKGKYADLGDHDIAALMQSHPEVMFRRGASVGGDGKEHPQYAWTQGDQALSEDDALRLERAIAQSRQTKCLNPESSDVVVRPDFANAVGQMSVFKMKTGKGGFDYTPAFVLQQARDKYVRVSRLLGVYDIIKKRIVKDFRDGKSEAALAYFMMRTKIRAGSKANTEDGIGASNLARGDLQLSDDGETFYASFNGKSKQWWHVTCKDKRLYDYIKARKASISGAGANDEPVFESSYSALRDYLHDISRDLVDNEDDAFNPHDFRRVGATRVAQQYLEKELVGVDPVKDRKKWEDRIYKAVVAAAMHLNDEPATVWKAYICPNVLFASSHEDLVRYHPYLEGVF